MWPKGTLPSPPDPAHDLLRTPGRGCLNEACKKIENTSLEGCERSYAVVEYMCTLAHAHFVHVGQDHRRRLSKRLLVHPRSYCKMLACKRMHVSTCFLQENRLIQSLTRGRASFCTSDLGEKRARGGSSDAQDPLNCRGGI